MPNWTRLTPPAAGAFSAGWITRIGAVLFALILGGAFLVQSCFSTVPTDPESMTWSPRGSPAIAPRCNSASACRTLSSRTALDAAAAERELAKPTGAQLDRRASDARL